MNKKLWRGAIVGGAMAVGLIAVPASLSTNTWVAGPMISDPMDLNHMEAQAFHTRWAAQVKAAKEEAARKEAEAAAAEAARKAAEAAAPRRTAVPPKANTTPLRQTPPVQQAPRDEWMETYNYWSTRLPGTWAIGEPIGSWGAASPDTGQVWIARRTPLWALKSVMIHEAGHVMQGRRWGSTSAAKVALAPVGLERTADCWALDRGATWANYGCDAEARRVYLANPF